MTNFEFCRDRPHSMELHTLVLMYSWLQEAWFQVQLRCLVCQRKKGIPLNKKKQGYSSSSTGKEARKLSRDFYPARSTTSIVMDDERNFALKGDPKSCNVGFYAADKENTPQLVKHIDSGMENYPTKVLVQAVVSE